MDWIWRTEGWEQRCREEEDRERENSRMMVPSWLCHSLEV